MVNFTSLENWKIVCNQLSATFSGLGQIFSDSEIFRYESQEPYVKTSFVLTKDGILFSKMPLHEIESRFDRICVEGHKIVVEGNSGKYTYKIPKEILKIRNSK